MQSVSSLRAVRYTVTTTSVTPYTSTFLFLFLFFIFYFYDRGLRLIYNGSVCGGIRGLSALLILRMVLYQTLLRFHVLGIDIEHQKATFRES